MKELPINELIARCKSIFEEGHYSRHRIGRYDALWKKGILKYMSQQGLTLYNPVVGEACLSSLITGRPTLHEEQELVRSITVLDDCLQLGRIRRHAHKPIVHLLHGKIGLHIQPLIDYLQSIRRSDKTIKGYLLYLGSFSRFLTDHGIERPEDVTCNVIVSFLNGLVEAKGSFVRSLRVLFKFWFERGITKDEKSEYLKAFKYVRKERIPSFYAKEEVMIIEKSVDRTSNVGKRNYAMLLLATRLGLRASDISMLRLEDLDWRNNVIRLIQYKTKKPIELPLLAEVGNAIIEYLRYGRPQTKSERIFLAARAPFDTLGNIGVSTAFNQIISTAGINLKNRRHGSHSMRHSLATALLNNGETIPVISESLGHNSTQTTMTYLKIDVRSMIECALPVPPVDDSFYKQKGGAFYE